MNYYKFLKENDIETIKEIVKNDLTIDRQFLFHCSCQFGHINIAQWLYELGFKIISRLIFI